MCSFSEVRNHELMWAHYADQFKGICISYSLSKLLKRLARDVSFVRMFYNETMPIVHRSNKEPSQLARMVLSYKNYSGFTNVNGECSARWAGCTTGTPHA
jgi:Protein of unknown function (DUF2971)